MICRPRDLYDGRARRRAAALCRAVVVPVAAAMLIAGLSLVDPPGASAQQAGHRTTLPAPGTHPARPARPARPAPPAREDYARPGTNLVLNPEGTVGVASAQGWDAVTIPGWQVQAGLPTVVDYGTPGFPKSTGPWPRGRLFVGGAGGTARIVQDVPFEAETWPRETRGTGSRATSPAAPGQGLRYQLSAWLGGTATSAAELTVSFLDARGKTNKVAVIGPVGRQARAVLEHRTATGTVPPGTTRAQVTLTLATTLTDANGPNAPQVGYDYATAADLSLTVSQPVRQPGPLTPPPAHVPRYQHVFLFYFENLDFNQIIGNTKQAPYLNSLTRKGALLSQFYAEEHPSDGNYLAVAGGSTFGVPLTDPEEENPLYTIDAKNIGDLIDAKHETWKAYLQSSDGPCDDTVHGYYWNDDQPMLYFSDVRGRPAYCASHVVPLEELPADLASPVTTPSFAWIAPDDCSDMEGCGIAAGDEFARTELSAIMASKAWRTQRCLAIITFDEDAMDFQHPAQRVATIIVGSRGIRQGYVSGTRYTHYSLLRTIEAALGLGTLTANDRYAQPVNDIFYPERNRFSASAANLASLDWPAPAAVTAASEPARAKAAAPAATAPAAAGPGKAGVKQPVAWVANFGSDSVTSVNLATRTAAPAVPVGSEPRAVAAAPDGATVYVANSGGDTVTPINAKTGRPGRPIVTGSAPWALALTPNGRTLYVANSASGTVTPVNTATGEPGRPVRVGEDPRAIVITRDGRTVYVLNWLSGTVTPIRTATDRALRPIPVGAFPVAGALSPDGKTLYVASFGGDTVTSVNTATGEPGRAVPAGYAPDALAATADGVYVVDGNSDRLTRLGARTTIPVGYSPTAIAVHGTTAYVVNTIDGTVTPVSTKTGRAARPLSVGLYSYPAAILVAGQTAIVLDTYGGQVSLIDTATNRVYAPLNVGAFPTAAAVTG
jgi:YVTN family beta-propeller protein